MRDPTMTYNTLLTRSFPRHSDVSHHTLDPLANRSIQVVAPIAQHPNNIPTTPTILLASKHVPFPCMRYQIHAMRAVGRGEGVQRVTDMGIVLGSRAG